MGIYTPAIANKQERGDGTWYCPLCSSTFMGESAFDLHQEYKDPLWWNPLTKGWLCRGAKWRQDNGLVREKDVWSLRSLVTEYTKEGVRS